MLDEIIQETFDLDYQIYSWINHKSKKYLNQIQNPKFNSNDIISYVSLTKIFFEELNQLLVECNEQRQNLRTILIKMSKDRMLIQKFFKEEDNSLILSKLNIHDELKSRINDKNLDAITHMHKTIQNLQNQLAYYKVELKVNSCNTTFHSNINYKSKDYVKTKSSVVNKKGTQNEKTIKQNKKKSSDKKKAGRSKSMIEDPESKTECNTGGRHETYDPICEYYTKNMPNLNLDFNTEKYNIISSSPIRTPTENRSKHKTVTNFKKLIKKLNNEHGMNSAKDKSIQNGQGRHVRNISFQTANKYESNNLLSFNKLKGEKGKSDKNDSRNTTNHNNALNHNNSNVKSIKLTEMKNLETSSNYRYVNTNIDSNERYSNPMDTSRKRILHSISKSIDFDMPFTNGNLLQNKLGELILNNEMLLEDPVPETFISFQTSQNPTPQTHHLKENSVSPMNYRHMLRSYDENYKVETDHRENLKLKVKNPEHIKTQRKKRNSMSELLFTNFLNKYNLSAREKIEGNIAENVYDYDDKIGAGTHFSTSGKKVVKNESLNDLKSILSSSNKKSSLNSLPVNHHRGTFCFQMKTLSFNSNPNKPNKHSTKLNNSNSAKKKWKV